MAKDYAFLYCLIQDHVYRMNQIVHQVVVVVAYHICLTKVPFKKLAEFIKSLRVTEEQARTIEQRTIEQCSSPYWFEVRKFCLTSYFGIII